LNVIDQIRERARTHPDHPALSVDSAGHGAAGGGSVRHIGYGELVARAEAHAGRLRDAGLRPGERCGLLAAQGAGFIELALGILAARACLAPIPDDHRGVVLEDFVSRSRLHAIVREGDPTPVFERCADDAATSVRDAIPEEDFRALDPAYLRFTSGTTRVRKGVLLGHARIVERLAAANRSLEIGPSDRVLWLLPMAHHFVVSILLYLQQGATVLLPSSSLARTVLGFARREGATVVYASPHHYGLLAADDSELALERVRLAVSTADGLRVDVAERFESRFAVPLTQALGIIEVGLPVINRASAAEKPGALGRPLPDYEVWLRAEDGTPLATSGPERTGEVCIRGPGMLDAYLAPWTPAARVLEPDGFRTGDQGWFDADGDLYLAGRRSNRISMAGMKFFAEEVEQVLDRHPGIRESRVFARPHAHLGEIPAAEIVPADPDAAPSRKELVAHCRGALAAYKVPREFRVVASLERTSSGKVRRARGAASPARGA